MFIQFSTCVVMSCACVMLSFACTCVRLREEAFYCKPVASNVAKREKLPVDKQGGCCVKWAHDPEALICGAWACALRLLGWSS